MGRMHRGSHLFLRELNGGVCGLVAEAYEWDEDDMSSYDNEMTEVKVLMALADDKNVAVGKESARNSKWVKISMRKVHTLLDMEDNDERKSFLDYLFAITDSSSIKYDSTNESSVCSTPLPPQEKLDGAEPISVPKTIKSILKSNSTFKVKALKGVTINEPSSAPAKAKALASKLTQLMLCERTDHRTCDHVEYMSTINMSQHLKIKGRSSSRSRTPRPSKNFFPPCIHCGFNDHLSDDYVNYPICDIYGSYDHDTHGHNRVISLRRGIKPRNHQQVTKSCETYGITVHTITDYNDIEWFRRGEALQAKKVEAFQSKKTESSNAIRSKTPTKRSINHEKYILVIVDEYSRNDIVVNFCDENGFHKKFPLNTKPEQNGVAERKNRTLIEAARTILLGSVFSKQYWTKAVAKSSTPEDKKLKKPITSHLMKALMLSNSQNLQMTTSPLLNLKDIHMMSIFIHINHLKDDVIINDDQSEHSNPNNNNHIIDNLPNTKDVHTSEPLSSRAEDALVSNIIPISTNPSLSILSMASLAPQDRWFQDKHIKLVNIIGNPGAGMLTKDMAKELSATSTHEYLFVDFLSQEEPKKVSEALKHYGWVDAMQEELNQFARNKVWTLVPAPYGKTIIAENGYSGTKEMKWELSSKTRLEAIRIILAFATYMNFTVYQIDVKNYFLNGKLEEEVYVKQTLCFESNEFPNHV
ncbi:retrovirus-related pol polyprotein from transposon TNT 1-94 [Tanacetum coccineum]